MPDITSMTTQYPASTLNLTAYVTAGTFGFINLYRTGASLPAEVDYVTVSGYIVPGA
jgi:hypothetical protein